MKLSQYLKKMFGVCMAMIMVIGLIGCGQKETQESNASEAVSSEESKTEETAVEDETASAEEEITYPLDTDVTLTFWMNDQSRPHPDYTSGEDSPAHIGLSERTGVDIKWEWLLDGADAEQTLSLMIADNELPQVFYSYLGANICKQLVDDGQVWDLSEYAPIYAPDFWAFMNRPENELELKTMSTADGKLFGIPSIADNDEDPTYIGPMVRQDWLDACGLEYPVTLEDWENVLVTLNEKYGAKLSLDMSVVHWGDAGLSSGTGAYAFTRGFIARDDDGNVVLPQTMPEWVELMEVMHKWWQMGLIDEDSLTQDMNAVRTKALNDQVAITIGAKSALSKLRNDAKEAGNGAEWVGIEYPRTAEGAPTSMINSRALRTIGGFAMISNACSEEEMIVALKHFNYYFTEEGIDYLNFGAEGVSYTKNADGTRVWVDEVLNDELGLSTGVERYSLIAQTHPGVYTHELTVMKMDEVVAEASERWSKNTEAPSHLMPEIPMTEEENEIYTSKFPAIETYIEEESYKFWTGERPLSEYDAFVEQLYEMGLQDVLDVWQTAYDRFIGE